MGKKSKSLLRLNYMHCLTCKHFTSPYDAAIKVHGKGYGLCNSRKLQKHVPASNGLLEVAVHENFGCIDYGPNLTSEYLTDKWRVKS